LLSPGDKLKDYEIVAPLPQGGMATLVLARRRGVGGFSRLVALKQVHEHLLEDSGMIRLFLDEARVTARIAHPNVVHVEEIGIHEGSYFLAMEYVHGVSLANLVRRLESERRRMSPQLSVYLAAQLAEALHAAHEATDESGHPLHVVHRDVSPQNVLISHTGHVKLIDFGIATSRAGAGLFGKLCYMAPEQVTLDAVDRRTDVYSLGIVLWEMLTGRQLFRSQNFSDYRDPAIRTRIAPPSRHAANIPAALDAVVMRALAPEPEMRWETALAFRRKLLSALPRAASIDAPKVSALLYAFVGDELERLRAALPDDITRELEATDANALGSIDDVRELTLVEPDPPAECPDPPSGVATTPIRKWVPVAATPSEVHGLDNGSGIKRRKRAAVPAASRPVAWLPWLGLNRRRMRSLLPLVATGAACLVVGLAMGRLTHPSPPSEQRAALAMIESRPVAPHGALQRRSAHADASTTQRAKPPAGGGQEAKEPPVQPFDPNVSLTPGLSISLDLAAERQLVSALAPRTKAKPTIKRAAKTRRVKRRK
jgi:eukaryotic-like serine/threonine-protein kinase